MCPSEVFFIYLFTYALILQIYKNSILHAKHRTQVGASCALVREKSSVSFSHGPKFVPSGVTT